MPLVSITTGRARRCRARSKRTKQQCWALAAYGCPTCRMHGARKPETILSGEDHPNYRHGERTLEGAGARGTELVELRQLEEELRSQRLLRGPRTRGRKPGSTS